MKNGVLFSCALFTMYSAALCGDTLTWSGGATGAFSDTTWTIGGAPAGRSPASGDSIVIPAECKVTAVNADAATLVGLSGVTLNGVLECSGFTARNDFNSPFALSGTGEFRMVSCGKTEATGVRLFCDNSAYTGEFWFSNTWVNVHNSKALGGATGGKVTFYHNAIGGSGGGFDFVASGTYPNDMYLNFAPGEVAMTSVRATKVVLSGTIVSEGKPGYCSRFACTETATAGTYTGNMVLKTGFIDFNGAILKGEGEFFAGSYSGAYVQTDARFLYIDTKLSTDISYIRSSGSSAPNGGEVKFFRENALNGVGLRFSGNALFNLNGYDQSTAFIRTDGAFGAVRRLTSPSSATLTLTGVVKAYNAASQLIADDILGIEILDKASFAYDREGGTLTLTNNVANPSTTIGSITAKKGKLILGDTANLPNVSLVAATGGTLSVANGAIVNDMTRLVLSDGGLLELEAVASGDALTVASATIDGTPVAKGVYSVSNPGPFAGRISGGGSVNVLSSHGEDPSVQTFVWRGGSGTSLSTDANWEGDVAPVLTGFASRLKFGASAAPAQVDGTIEAYGIVFEGSQNFTLAAASGAKIRVGFDGITVSNTAPSSSAKFTVEADVEYSVIGHDWFVATNSTLAILGDLTADPEINYTSVELVVNGTGALDLSGDNAAFLPKFHFPDYLQPIIRSNTALGSPTRPVITCSVPNAYKPLTNNVPLEIYKSWHSPGRYRQLDPNYTYFVQGGKVTFMDNKTGYLSVLRGEIAGGVESPTHIWLQASANGSTVGTTIRDNPVKSTYHTTFDDAGYFYLSATGNQWTNAVLNVCYIRCDNDGVLCPTGGFTFGGVTRTPSAWFPNGITALAVLDLNGHDQSVDFMNTQGDPNPKYSATSCGLVTSSVPAKITITGAKNIVNGRMRFDGAVSLDYRGSGFFTLTNFASRTTGSLRVGSGEVRIEYGAGWAGRHAPVEVCDGATLKVIASGAPTAFGGDRSTVALNVNSGGKVDVLGGATVTVGSLVVGGTSLPRGTYSGANGSGDKTYAAFFGTGTGSVFVRGYRGLMILVN